MRWLKRNPLNGIAIGILLFLVLITWIFIQVGKPQPGHAPTGGTVQGTPTVNTTAVVQDQLKQQDEKLQRDNSFPWIILNAIGSSIGTILVAAAALIAAWLGWRQWLTNRKDEQEKRAEERFQKVVEGFGGDNEGAKVGAAILLRTFLRPGYEEFYIQTFDLAIAHLRPPGTPPTSESEDPNTVLPLPTLRQALIIVFKEAFPLARSQSKGSPQSLDAAGIQLDNAYMRGADLKQIWIPQASLRKADLSEADLSGAKLSEADLSEADLSEANLSEANLSGIDLSRAYLGGANLSKANLSGAKLREADFSRTKLSVTYSGKGRIKLDQLFEVYFSGADLSGADLSGADLSEAKLCATNLRSTDLNGANLSGADLSEADLHGAYFGRANFGGTNLHRVKGLTTEQLEDCKAKGAIDKGLTISSTPSPISPSPPSQSNDMQTPSTLSVQESILPSNTGKSAATPSQQSKGVQVQSNTPTPDTDGNNTTSSL